MKRNNITQYLIPLLLLLLAACGKEEKIKDTPILGLGGDTWVNGPIDDWLKKEFLDPYNIEVKYRWDPYELNYVKSIVPIREEKIQPSMSSVREIWIKPYVKVAGESFIKKYAPKQFVLAGSAEWNNDGTIVLGQAEGGRKIVLLLLNEFDPKDRPQVERMLHTMHHEFAHILHQTKLYPLEWKALNPEWYTATWFNNTDDIAHQQGLISAYAKANADEDFVETVSFFWYTDKLTLIRWSIKRVFRQKPKRFLERKKPWLSIISLSNIKLTLGHYSERHNQHWQPFLQSNHYSSFQN